MLGRLHKRVQQLENLILVGSLLLTIGIAVLQIFLRNLFDTGIVWGDSFLRITVLWIGMLGAMHASRDNNHISIDIGLRFLPERFQPWVEALAFIFAAVVCSIAAWYSLSLVQFEIEGGDIAFASVPVWLTQSIIPFAFGVIALRYFLASVLRLKQ